MDARHLRIAALAIVLSVCSGAAYRTRNFVVNSPDQRFAAQVARAAEKYRRELAVAWLGKPLPDWSSPCVTTVRAGSNLGAGGATTFMFDRGEVHGWRMNIQGTRSRLLDSVLPHEITHTIMATHFRRPLPRWADEGAATSVEHISERTKYYRMLHQFLRSGRGISFGHMFAMSEYPTDVLPLYAQGFTLVDFLLRHGGRRRFVAFLEDGLDDGRWPAAMQRHYRWANVATLQNDWLAWVANGCPSLSPDRDAGDTEAGTIVAAVPRPGGGETLPLRLASSAKLPRPQPNLIFRIPNAADASGHSEKFVATAAPQSSPSAVSTLRSQSARPQGVQKSRQVILEWRNR